MSLKFKRLSVLVVAGVLGMAALPASTAPKSKAPNVGAKMTTEKYPVAASVEAMYTADMMLRIGYANKDPLALITGAKIKKAATASDAMFERVAGVSGLTKSKPDTRSVDAALIEAKKLAFGRPDLIALADDVAKSGGRGAVGGARQGVFVVERDTIDEFTVEFKGKEPARVFLSGDGDSDLDLTVHDENGIVVCSDNGASDAAMCSWTPRATAKFTIKVKNLGMMNRYTLMTN